MGGGQSRQIQNIVREEPYPQIAGADGLSLSQAEKCNACRLGVDTKITTSNIKLKREQGAFTSVQCQSFTRDMDRVANKTLSATDMLAKLQNGGYARPTTESGGQQYCEEVIISEEDAAAVREDPSLLASKVKGGRIRKVSGASFSEETKAKFIPSIPFKMFFEAKKAAFDSRGKIVYQPVSNSFDVTQMTVYHPAPIRIDSVQSDAILSLNDPTDPQAKFIVLIPLRATNSGNPSNTFFNKIAPHLFSIKEPRPDTGDYDEITIPTGADWALDKLFTLTGDAGSSTVKNGFFTWTGVAEYERYNKGVTFDGNAFITTFGWRQKEGINSPQYIMLDTPLDINSEDFLALTQSLPTTPVFEAIHPVPGKTNLIYHKSAEPPAPDTMSGKASCGLGNLCEGFTTGVLREGFEGCPGARCDPFLQNAAKASDPTAAFTPSWMLAILFSMMTVIAMLVGAYFALRLISEDYDFTIQNFAQQIGQVLAVWAKGVVTKVKMLRDTLSEAKSLSKGDMSSSLDE